MLRFNEVICNQDILEDLKNKLTQEYLDSFLTKKQFCENHKISEKTLDYVMNLYNLKKDLKKYNPSKRQDVLNKIKKSKIDHYGSLEECNKQSVEKNKKTRYTHFNGNYFSEYTKNQLSLQASKSENVEKRKQGVLKKYGVDNIFKTENFVKKSFQKKYNIDNPSQLDWVKDKKEKTFQNHFNVNNSFKSPEIKEKIRNTNLQKYGVENPSQNLDILQKSKLTRLKNNNQFFNGNEVDLFLSNWKLDRKPTVEDLRQYLLTKDSNLTLTNTYKLLTDLTREKFELRRSFLESIVEDFLKSNNINFEKHNRQIIKPQELDFYLPDYKLALEVNDIFTHNSTLSSFNNPPKPIDYHFKKTQSCKDKGIRLIHLYEPHLYDSHKWTVLQDIILHACGKSKKLMARKTDIIIDKAIKFKKFFEDNNINGYRKADTVFILIDKVTKEPLMGYALGDSFLGRGKYDAEIARGACKLGYQIVGGSSKLWKHIIDYYSNKGLKEESKPLNSIVYYVDRNYYDGNSLRFLTNTEFVSEQYGFWNYFVETKELKNRDPLHNREIKELEKQGKVLIVGNSGTSTYVWKREI